MRAKVSSEQSCKLVKCGLLVLSSLLSCNGAYAASGVPDWMKAAAQQTIPHYTPSTEAVVLLHEVIFTVAPDGRATRHVREVVKVLRPSGRGDAIPVVYFDKDQKVLSMHVWSIGPDGHEYAVKDNEISEYGVPGGGGELYNDERVKVMSNPPGLDVGGVVGVEYEVRERPYLAETSWYFQGSIPHVKESFTLLLPEGFTHTTTWAHHAASEGVDLEHQKWRWDLEQVPGIDLDQVPMPPSHAALSGRMTVHYAGPTLAEPQEGTWKGIGEWYDRLSRDRLAATPEIAAKAAELTQGKSDFYDKTEAIGEFTQQQVRYSAIEIGVGGYQPHFAAEIFKGRYGDCKDKATLLSAMLGSVGVHSALLMVDTERGAIDPGAPSIYGNHMIAAIEIPKGYESAKLRSVVTAKTGKRYLIFDPTWEKTPFGQLEFNLQGSYGVLMEGGDSQVIRLPVLDPGLNTMRRSAAFVLKADGELTGRVTEKQFGDLSERRRDVFAREDAREQQKYMDRLVDRDFNSVKMTDLRVENLGVLNKDLTTTYAIDAKDFSTQTGPLLMVRPRVLGTLAMYVDHKERKVPIDLGSTRRETDDYEIELPSGYTVDELPDPVKLDVGFAVYESSTVVTGQKLHYSRSLTMREVTLSADKYPQMQHLSGVIAADEQNRAIFKKTN